MGTSEAKYSIAAVIPAYNVGHCLCRAIESVLAQTRPADEIIVVDDGSTDGTAEAASSFAGRVRFIRQQHAGASVARNTAVEAAGSEWIAFLDADDEWLPHKLAEQIEFHRRNPGLVWSATNYEIRPVDGSPPRLTFDLDRFGSLCKEGTYLNYFEAVTSGMALSTITTMVRRTALLESGMFLPGQSWAQDTDLFFRIAYRWPRIGYLHECLSVNHFGRPESITQKNWFLIPQRCDLIERHLKLAAEHGMSESFRPCAVELVSRWLRGYAGQPEADVAHMLRRFRNMLPLKLRMEMRMRMFCPRTAERLMSLYSRWKRRILARRG